MTRSMLLGKEGGTGFGWAASDKADGNVRAAALFEGKHAIGPGHIRGVYISATAWTDSTAGIHRERWV